MIDRGRRAGAVFVFILTALLSAAAAPAGAQQDTLTGRIQGILIDEITRTPVVQGDVRLLSAGGQTVLRVLSDGEGRFSLHTPGPGPYRVRVERLGYQIKESGEFSVPPGHALSVEIHLAPMPLLLDSVQVVGHRRALRPTEQLIQGWLRDFESGEPIPQGTVSLLKAQGVGADDFGAVDRVISDDSGLFSLISPLPGTYRLRGERLGYRTTDSPDLNMMPGDTVLLDLYMSVEAIVLDPITVRASARPWEDRYSLLGMEAFFHRQSRFGPSGFGTFLTRDSLARHDGRTGTGRVLLSTVGAVRFVNHEGGVVLVHGCNPRYYVDGLEIVRGDPVHQPMQEAPASTPLSEGFDLELLYPPETLEAIEVYVSPAIPGEFLQGYPCGVVAMWTRRRR